MENVETIVIKTNNTLGNKMTEIEDQLNISKSYLKKAIYIVKEEFLKVTEENIRENASFFEKVDNI